MKCKLCNKTPVAFANFSALCHECFWIAYDLKWLPCSIATTVTTVWEMELNLNVTT